MFSLTPIGEQTGELGDWGFPYHGLLEFHYQDPNWVDQGGGGPGQIDRSTLQTHPLPGQPGPSGPVVNSNFYPAMDKFVGSSAVRKLQVPGRTFTRDPELAEYDKVHGFDYREFVLVGSNFIGGFDNIVNQQMGWIYIDPDGGRWSITLTNIFVGSGNDKAHMKWTMGAKEYGNIRYPHFFWGIRDEPQPEAQEYILQAQGDASLTDFSINATAIAVLEDINTDGSRAIWSLGGNGEGDNYDNFNRSNLRSVQNQTKSIIKIAAQGSPGFTIAYEVVLTGTPGNDFQFSVNVLRSQALCRGELAKNQQDIVLGETVWGGGYFIFCTEEPPPFGRKDLTSEGVCDPPFFAGESASIGTQSLIGQPGSGVAATACGFARILPDLSNVIGEVFNTYNGFKWWTWSNPDLSTAFGDPWLASKEYVVGEKVGFGGFVFECIAAHTSDPLKQPAFSVLWPAFWEIKFRDTVYDISDIEQYVVGGRVFYNQFDAVHTGTGDYYIAKGSFTSWDDDPAEDQINYDQPEVGENWELFWDGPHNVLLAPTTWFAEKVINKDWIIDHPYDEVIIQDNNHLDDASWKCIRTHVSSASNEPGTGPNWPQYWEQALQDSSTPVGWIEPIVYSGTDRVFLDIDGGPAVDNRTYKLAAGVTEILSTDDNKPPNVSFWEEVTGNPDCLTPQLLNLVTALNNTAFHINGHRPKSEDIDIHFKNITVGMMYKDNGSIRLFECDMHYTRDLDDLLFDHEWLFESAPFMNPYIQDPVAEPLEMLPDDALIATGSLTRGPAKVDEVMTMDFRVDGGIAQTITFISKVTANGHDNWTEKYSTGTNTWDAAGTRTKTFNQNGVETVNFNESWTQANTVEFGGQPAVEDVNQPRDKGGWQSQDFCSGLTFQWVNNPPMTFIKNRFVAAANANNGTELCSQRGSSVGLGEISNFNQYTTPHPFRTQEQIDEGEPFPSLQIVKYGNKLIGPILFGRKGNDGITLDSQYFNVLRPDDMPWIQYGVYGPDSQRSDIVTLTHGSPIEVSSGLWVFKDDYGDDVSCAYDPITFAIERNSQYRVTFV